MKVRVCPWCGHHNPEDVWWCTCGGTLSVDTIVDLPDEANRDKQRAKHESPALPTERPRRHDGTPQAQADEVIDAPQQPKGRFCTQCGAELEDSHKFCHNCGHPRTGGAPVEEPVWETCIIACEAVRDNKFLGSHSGQARWWAKATGPEGSYRAGESPIFYARVIKGDVEIPVPTPYWTHLQYVEAQKVLDELTCKLVADGWEAAGKYGGSYWQWQYRRRIR